MEEQNPIQQDNPLGTEPIGRLLLRFAVPSVISMLVGSVYNIIDQFFIGRTVGVLGNSATNVAFPLVTCCVALALLFGIGGASAFNLAMGRKEYDKAPLFIGNAAMALFVSGVLLCVVTLVFLTPLLRAFGSPDEVLPYAQTYVRICAFGYPFHILTVGGGHLIRADGTPRMVMVCTVSGAVINVVLDAVFVMGLGRGMAGAALATVIGQVFSGCLVIWYIIFRFHTVPLKPRYFLIRPSMLGRCTYIGTASCVNQLAILVLQIVLNHSLNHYGALSVYGAAIPLAVSGITLKVSQLAQSVIIGINQGSQPILSFNYGAQQYDRVRRTFWRALSADLLFCILAELVFQLFPRQILGLFGEGSEIYFQCGVLFFRTYMLLLAINCVQPLTSTFFTAMGKPFRGIILSLTRQVIFLIPMMLIFPLIWGFNGVLYAFPIADALAFAASALMGGLELRRLKRLETAAQMIDK